MSTPHLMSLGARMIPRSEFTRALAEHIPEPLQPGLWTEPGNEPALVNV
jgi:Leu/Phe-tRNA-protein transferase